MKEMPAKVKEIADAIKRDNPEIDDETKFKMAWAQYKKMGKGKDYGGMGGGYGAPSDIGVTGMIPYKAKKSSDLISKLQEERLDEDTTLSSSDKKVIADFLKGKAAGNAKLQSKSIGNKLRLDGRWMGGDGIAEFDGKEDVVFKDLGSRSAQTVQRYIKKQAKQMGIYVKESTLSEVTLAKRYQKGHKVDKKDIEWKEPLANGKGFFVVIKRDLTNAGSFNDAYKMAETDKNLRITNDWGTHPSARGARKFAVNRGFINESTLSEAVKISDKFKHKNSGKVFVISSIGDHYSVTGRSLGKHAHLYPEGGKPDDKNAMTIPVGNVSKFFTAVNESVSETMVPREFDSSLQDQIVDFFAQHPYPNDMQVHEFAAEIGIHYEKVENAIFALLTDLLGNGGYIQFASGEQ